MSLIPSCPEVREHLTEYLEGTLPFHKRLGIRIHLLICAACDGLLKALRALPAFGRKVLEAPVEPPREAAAALERALERIAAGPGKTGPTGPPKN
jgi:anti-sigma factor RsiW